MRAEINPTARTDGGFWVIRYGTYCPRDDTEKANIWVFDALPNGRDLFFSQAQTTEDVAFIEFPLGVRLGYPELVYPALWTRENVDSRRWQVPIEDAGWFWVGVYVVEET